jgi:hypothetical protein
MLTSSVAIRSLSRFGRNDGSCSGSRCAEAAGGIVAEGETVVECRTEVGPVERADGKFAVVDEVAEVEIVAGEIGVESEKDVALEDEEVEEGIVEADVDCEHERVDLVDGG